MSKRKFIPLGHDMPRVLNHLLSRFFLWITSSVNSLSITHTDRSDSEWLALLKWAATGDSSILSWEMSNRWSFIILWSGCPDSPTYWRPHLLHFIRWTILLVLNDACILMVNRSPVALLTNTLVVFSMGQVLQWPVLHKKLPGVSFLCNVKVVCTSNSLFTLQFES